MMLSLKTMLQNTVDYMKDELELVRKQNEQEGIDEEIDTITDEMVSHILNLSSLHELRDYLVGLPYKDVCFWDFDDEDAWEFIAYAQLNMEIKDV